MKRRVSSQYDIKQTENRTLQIIPKQKEKLQLWQTRRNSSRPRESTTILTSIFHCRGLPEHRPFEVHNIVGRARPTTAAKSKPTTAAQVSMDNRPRYRANNPYIQASDLSNFTIGHEIGRGAYAQVKSAVHKRTNQRVALKIYERSSLVDPKRSKSVEREIRILSGLDHPNIVKLFEVIHTDSQVILVLEHVSGQSLRSIVKKRPYQKLNEAEAKNVFRALISAVSYCHSKNVSHRDIKMDNVLVDKNCKVKLIDFGFATCHPPQTKIKMFCGTPSYMAPEIVNRKEFEGLNADVWACGVLLFAIITGNFPFKGISDKDLFGKIHRGIYVLPDYIPVSPRLLIKNMLEYVPEKRPTAKAILGDSWLNVQKKAVCTPQASMRYKHAFSDVPFLTEFD